jgi:hypothetical protein
VHWLVRSAGAHTPFVVDVGDRFILQVRGASHALFSFNAFISTHRCHLLDLSSLLSLSALSSFIALFTDSFCRPEVRHDTL